MAVFIPTFFGITLLTFAMIRLIPGDPIELMAGERGIDPERHAILRAEMGLDDPIVFQYLNYIGDVLQGDLGVSVVTKTPVLDEFLALFPATVELSFFAIIFALSIGLPLGIIAALRRGSMIDYTTMGISLTGYSMPVFWWALILMMVFSVTLGWTPVSGRISFLYYVEPVTGFLLIDTWLEGNWAAFKSALWHLVLPATALGTIPMAVIARMTRSSMLEVLGEDYIRTARAKGLSSWRVVMIHGLRNAMIPLITVIGLQVGVLLAGAILTETMFSWPGIGKWLIESVRRRDYPSLQGGVLLISAVVIIVNLIVDVLYGVFNPRIRKQ
jgi:dipeptide transport system permease protein